MSDKTIWTHAKYVFSEENSMPTVIDDIGIEIDKLKVVKRPTRTVLAG